MNDPESPSYILIPGAGGMAWYWHRVVGLLEQAQREAIAVDLPGDDESAGLDDYAEIVVREIGQRTSFSWLNRLEPSPPLLSANGYLSASSFSSMQ
jgi:hypothetical protein